MRRNKNSSTRRAAGINPHFPPEFKRYILYRVFLTLYSIIIIYVLSVISGEKGGTDIKMAQPVGLTNPYNTLGEGEQVGMYGNL